MKLTDAEWLTYQQLIVAAMAERPVTMKSLDARPASLASIRSLQVKGFVELQDGFWYPLSP